MRTILTYLAIICSFFSVEAQAQHRVTGDIQGEKKEPLQNVSIFFFAQDTLTAGTISDTKGHFEIEGRMYLFFSLLKIH